jgi:uncharacterized repeat protein (TIGR03803 family)
MRRRIFLAVDGIVLVLAATFLMNAPVVAQQEEVLHNFNSTDGSSPDAGVIFDRSGNLYGTTYSGGSHSCSCGTVFELTRTAGGGWKEKVLHSFSHGTDGFGPAANLILDSAGNLYSTAAGGGSNSAGLVFELMPGSGGAWTEKVLHNFTLADAPLSGLIFDSAGDLYGTGGAGGVGVVYELIPGSGGVWTEKILYSFSDNGVDGFYPKGGLLLTAGGTLFGTTQYGGTSGYGTVYELKEIAGAWKEKVLYSFTNSGSDGEYPTANVVADSAGNLYGMTTGNVPPVGGSIFELVRGAGGSWTELVLHDFVKDGVDGIGPIGGLVFDASGNLYGTTEQGGTDDGGTVFELSPEGGGNWTETILHNFSKSATDGGYPEAGLVFDVRGNLYGTTAEGGADGMGTVFEVRP